ncbi:MAG: outer membrane beta-barrel protein [Bacteroidota bacterium]
MTKFGCLLLLMCCVFETVAQQRKHELSLTSGLSVPVGDFASTDITNSNAGRAMTGGNFSINYQYNLSANIGLLLLLGGTSCEIDASNLVNTSVSPLTSETRYWSIGGYRAGGTFHTQLHKQLTVECRVTAGFNTVTFGGILLSDHAGNTLEIAESSTAAFVYSLGVGAKYHLSRSIFIPLFIDFLGCKANFSDVQRKENGINKEVLTLVRSVNYISLSAGLGFTF